jgi:hypothetical protein
MKRTLPHAGRDELPNPYAGDDGVPRLRPSFVCYADILGYKGKTAEAIREGRAGEFLVDLRDVLSEAHNEVREAAKLDDVQSFFAMTVFTDNIVVGYPVRMPDSFAGEPELGHVLAVFSMLQVTLAMRSLFVRGGVSFGDHYMDEDIVFGPALLDAVAQDKSGGPPRITVNGEARQLLAKQIEFHGYSSWSPQWEAFLQDSDGEVFINYLNVAFNAYPEGGVHLDLVRQHRGAIESGLERYRGRPAVRAKYEWLARYHNFFCTEAAERHPVPTSPDADEMDACAAAAAQKLLDEQIDIEATAPYPERLPRPEGAR